MSAPTKLSRSTSQPDLDPTNATIVAPAVTTTSPETSPATTETVAKTTTIGDNTLSASSETIPDEPERPIIRKPKVSSVENSTTTKKTTEAAADTLAGSQDATEQSTAGEPVKPVVVNKPKRPRKPKQTAAAETKADAPTIPTPPPVPARVTHTATKTDSVSKKCAKSWKQKTQSVKTFFNRIFKWIKSTSAKIWNTFLSCVGLNKDAEPLNEPLPVQDENFIRSVKDQKKPIRFVNNNKNNCWFNSSLAMLNAFGDDFFKLISDKARLIKAEKQQYDQDLIAYNTAKTSYDTRKASFDRKKADYDAYKAARKEYEQNLLDIQNDFDEVFKAASINFLLAEKAIRAWKDGGKEGPKPELPINPLDLQQPELPEQPEVVKEPKPIKRAEPKKPIEPYDRAQIQFINMLIRYRDAVKTADQAKIRVAARNVYNLIPQISVGEFENLYRQQDAGAFFTLIMNFIYPSLKTEDGITAQGTGAFVVKRQNRGIVGKPSERFYGTVRYTAENMLQLELPQEGNVCNFQSMLDNAFKPEKFETAVEMYKDGNEDDMEKHTEGYRYASIEGDLPEVLLVQAKRFIFPTPQEYKAEQMEKIVNQFLNDRKIHNLTPEAVQQIIAALPKELTSGAVDFKKITAAVANIILHNMEVKNLSAREKKLLRAEVEKAPDMMQVAARKDNRTIRFPANGIVTIKGVEYIPTAVVNHSGAYGAGHYTAAVRGTDPEEGHTQWYHADDLGGGKITEIEGNSIDDALGKGYMFMLRKVKKEPVVEAPAPAAQAEAAAPAIPAPLPPAAVEPEQAAAPAPVIPAPLPPAPVVNTEQAA